MTKHERLRDMAEAAEARAAALAREIAAALMRPTRERADLPPLIEEFDTLRQQAALHLLHLQRIYGREARGSLRKETRVMSGPQYVRLLTARMRMWDRMIRALADATAGREWPLLPDRRDRLDLGAAQEAVMALAFTLTHRAVNPAPQAETSGEAGCYPDIPTHVGRFIGDAHLALRLLMARKAAHPRRFVDVGCGGGVKVLFAAKLFDEADGIEYDEGYAAVAQRTFAATRSHRCSVIHADGRTFGDYAQYDVIFFFWPIFKDDLMIEMEQQIIRTARPGTILIAPYDGFRMRHKAHGAQWIAASTYVMGVTEAEADALAAEARRMGPHIPDPDALLPSETGWLRPVWEACLANGIRPDLDAPGY